MVRIALYTIPILLTLFCSSCVPESKKIQTEVELNLSDPILQNLITHEYAQNVDSLASYFNHENPTYRYLVARAAASIQKEEMLDSLYTLLDDPVVKVRAMAVYAIGQIGASESEEALLNAFRQKDTMSVDNPSNAAILESVGKLGSANLANLLIDADGYRDTDTLLMRGKMKCLYQFALRGIHNEKISTFLVDKLKIRGLDPQARLYAAHSLARSQNLNIETLKFQIAELFSEETDANVKMALALALRNTNDPEIQKILLSDLESESDYRVRVNTIRALSNYSYIESAGLITELIRHENIHIAKAACDFIYANGIKEDVNFYRQISRDSLPWQVKSHLLKSINKVLPYYYSKSLNSTRWQIQQIIKQETDTTAISHYLNALAHDPASYPWIIDFITEHNNSQLLTSGISTLSELLSDENFNGTFKSYAAYHRRKILEFVQEQMLQSADEGILGATAEMIANEKTQLAEFIDSTNFLFDARDKLKNPDHIESIHSIERAIAQVRGVRNANLTPVAQSKSPDWSLLNEFNTDTKVIVKTNKGNFTIELMMDNSPGTVLNFLDLVKQDFYDGKAFHRVVPNFVVQTGSPRADNYGGMDYVINSELGPVYYNDQGYVGMASAGRHTESSQWFITHSPTPHLDGKYTIFGKLTEGIELLHSIQVGDKIEDIIISNL